MKATTFKAKLLFLKIVLKGKLLQNTHYIQMTVEKCAVQSTRLGFFVAGLRKIKSLYVCKSAIPLSTLTVKFSWLFFSCNTVDEGYSMLPYTVIQALFFVEQTFHRPLIIISNL